MNTEQVSPHRLEPGEVNLSSWTVKLSRSGMGGWGWEANHADGREVVSESYFTSKANAEKAAVKRLMRIEQGEDFEEIDAFKLQIRVRERERESSGGKG